MKIKSLAGTNIEINFFPQGYTSIYWYQFCATIDKLVTNEKAILVTEAEAKNVKKKGFFIYAGEHQQIINGEKGKSYKVFAEISKDDFDKIQETIDNAKKDIIEKIMSGQLQVAEKIIKGDSWEGIPDTIDRSIEGVKDSLSVDSLLNEVKELRKTPEQKQKEELRKAYENGLCPYCNDYCYGDCGLTKPEPEIIDPAYPAEGM